MPRREPPPSRVPLPQPPRPATASIPSRARSRSGPFPPLALLVLAAAEGIVGTTASHAQTPNAVPGWTEATGYRFRALTVPQEGRTGFQRLDGPALGISFSNRLGAATVSTNRLLEIGSGVALGDVDGDGRVDIYLCGLESGNALYRNLGNWRFEDITASGGAGLACAGQFSTGCALVDLEGDGDLDLLVNGLGFGTRSFLNRGNGTFEERADLGFLRMMGATSFAIADIDLDGDLDVYVTNYRTDSFFDRPRGLRLEMRRQPDGSQIVEPRERFLTLPMADGVPFVVERGEPDVLYINRGDGRFVPIRWDSAAFGDASGAPLSAPPTDWGLSAVFRDLNRDGWPDLYVCNDFVHWPDRIWLNDSGRRFLVAPSQTVRSVSLASMAVDFADLDRDGFDDFIVADMLSPRRGDRVRQRPDTLDGKVRWPVEEPEFRPETPRNTLHRARGDGTFAEIAQYAGLAATDWTPGLAFLDVDLDGWEDLLVATGNLHDVQDADALAAQAQIPARTRDGGTPESRRRERDLLPPRRTPLMAFRNRHDLTFASVGEAWGFHDPGFAQGMAFGDLDDDGDLDVVLNVMNEPARLYRNTSTAPRLALRARGQRANTRGVGARLVIRGGGPIIQSQELMAGGRFASSDDTQRTFASGEARELSVEVHWPGGHTSSLSGVRPNHLYEIDEPPPRRAPPRPPAQRTWFHDVSTNLTHRHVDSPHDEFSRHPLRHRKLSTLGPGIAWADLDADGHEELLVAGGRNGRSIALRRGLDGRFSEFTPGRFPPANRNDHSALLALPAPDRAIDVWAAVFPGEDAQHPEPMVTRFPAPATAGNRPLTSVSLDGVGAGPLASADIDLDGDLDLFVGGRAIPERYPEPASSILLIRQGDQYEPSQTFTNLGLVSGAVFADLDLDGDPDLALACEWGPPRLFRNTNGRFTDTTHGEGLAPWTGWWNGIATGDFDGDGSLDLALSNWGLNARPDAAAGDALPVVIHFGDLGGDGTVQSFLASFDAARQGVFPWRERKAFLRVMPALATRFPDHRSFELAPVDALLSGITTPPALQAASFESAVFLNRTSRWERVPLPAEAQFAPAFGVVVADFDGNGTHDLFLAQNFFGVDAESSRQDAGTGLVLSGLGNARFVALSPAASGIFIDGEQRGAAAADFNHDGRVDLAVGVHRGPVRLFANAGPGAGLRVRLQGRRGNPSGVGTIVRARWGNQLSPAHVVTAGSGYGSQDSSVMVLGVPRPPEALLVRWPGEATATESPVPAGSREIVVTQAGQEPARAVR